MQSTPKAQPKQQQVIVNRDVESGTTATRGEKKRIGASMFQTRTATQGASIFGGTKQTLG